MTTVRIAVLFPATFNLNADVANAAVLVRRLNLSGVDAEVVALDDATSLDSGECDALIIGSPSSSVLADPNLPRTALARFVSSVLDASIPTLAVSNGFHLLGSMTGRDGTVIPGLELIPVSTVFGRTQHVTIGARVTVGDRSLIGVENHNATVTIDTPAHAFGTVTRGFGNDGGDFDGYAHGSLVATHLHGPLFALNAGFADEFCSAVLARRGSTFERGDALDALDALTLAAAGHLDRQAKS